jgi:apolipoprotein N-acyltransferase
MAERPASVPSAAMRAGAAAPGLSVMARRLGAWLDRQSPWRVRAMAFLLGTLGAAALPPVYAVPVLVVSFSGLVLLVDRTPRTLAAIALGWFFAFGYFVAGIYWVANALLSVSSAFGWLLPFAIAGAVGGLSALLAVFPALAVGLARVLWPAGLARILVLAICWTLFEWLRGWVLTGFPWNLLGTCWAFSDAMNQFAALVGIWGLSLVTVVVAALPALLVDWSGRRSAGDAPLRRTPSAAGCVVSGLVLLLAIWVGGAIRLSGASISMVPDVRLRLVQANVDPGEKGSTDRADDVLDRHLRLTMETPGYDTITQVIWSETAEPFPLERFPDVRMRVAAAAPENGVLITGVLRTDPPDGEWKEIWNSMAVLDRSGRIVGSYDKFHLVPFGEYVPLHRFLPFISKFTPGIADFSAGPGPRTLRLPGLPPVGPLICYEAIFPGQVVDRSDRPQWLLNITNDGWYGISSGPYQHFVSTRLRAVEEGLPVVRAANTGISGVVDPYGRVLAQTRLGEATALDVELPQPLQELTPYARWGDAATAVLLAIVTLIALAAWRRN